MSICGRIIGGFWSRPCRTVSHILHCVKVCQYDVEILLLDVPVCLQVLSPHACWFNH